MHDTNDDALVCEIAGLTPEPLLLLDCLACAEDSGSRSKWSTVSPHWSHKTQVSVSWRWCRFLLSAVQILPCSARQKKSFILGGARDLHSSLAPSMLAIPTKKTLYAEDAEYAPSAVHRHTNLSGTAGERLTSSSISQSLT